MSAAPIAAPANAKIEKTREVRLGLVMYGGVSLAIYINGVAHELFRAVRGRGVYRLIKWLTRSDVTVDVLSGTSAGGINGIFLAYALCNEVEFGECAALWRKHGDIDKLLRQIDAPPDEYVSLLDSEGFYQPKLVEAFKAMADAKCASYDGAEDVTVVPELDLMVTGTDFNGRIYETVDDRGNVIQVKDHRTLFWLKHRRDRKHPFAPAALPGDAPPASEGSAATDTHEALAKLARITSCFPAAFAPVTVAASGPGADARLRLWGSLDGEKTRVFLDGGVLDNKPFTSTLDAIYHRTATRAVERHLLYVEPDPEQFQANAEPVVPDLVRAAIDSLTRLPAYESIAGDLQSLADHNDSVERLKEIGEVAGNPPPPDPRAEPTVSGEVYRRARLSGFADGVLGELFQRARDGASRAALSALRTWFQKRWVRPVGGGNDLLDDFDVDIRLRRLFALSYACETELLERKPLLRTLNNQVQVLEMIRRAMQAEIGKVALGAPGTEEVTWQKVRDAAARVLAAPPPGDYGSPDPSRELLDDDRRKAWKVELDAAIAMPGPVGPPTFLRKADLFFDDLLAALVRLPATREGKTAIDALAASDAGFAGRDRLLFPLEAVSKIHEKDVIHTVRISPRDAQGGLSDKPLEKKVTGINVGHFGAFFKRSWRSNDILWGRLDAACELVDTLLDVERLKTLCAQGWRTPSAAEVRGFLPCLSEDGCAALATALGRMIDGTTVVTELPEVKRLLLEAAHREVLVEGLPQVVKDAAEQQMLWNEYNGRTVERSTGPEKFRAGAEMLDPVVVAAAAAEIAQKSTGDMAAERPPERLVAFFEKEYAVGEEQLENIPRVVLLDIVARALLVVRNSLLQAVGDRASNLRESWLFKVFLDWPLRALVTLASGLRRAPTGRRTAVVAALLYSIVSAVVVVKTRLKFEDLGGIGVGLFVGLPILLLGASAFLVSIRKGESRWTLLGRGLWATIKIVLTLVVLGVLVALWRFPANGLCGSALQTLLGISGTICNISWVRWLTIIGKGIVIGGVALAPIGRIARWFFRRVSPPVSPKKTGRFARAGAWVKGLFSRG